MKKVTEKVFYYYNHIHKTESDWGSIGIKHVTFCPKELREKIPEIVFQRDNLGYMFQSDLSIIDNHINTCDRFVPLLKQGQSVSDYIKNHGNTNNNFYSFLAEGLLALVYRDITGYKTAKAVIDIDGTLNDSHTGADACMYDDINNVIVLGEAICIMLNIHFCIIAGLRHLNLIILYPSRMVNI